MNQLTKVFNDHELRIIEKDGEAWFVGKEVAEILGYANTKDAISSHVDEEDRVVIQRSGNATLEIPNRGLTVINESGLYSLILKSRMPDAKKFKRWVTSEVLPSIRKNGLYLTNKLAQEITDNPEVIHFIAEQVARINTTNLHYHEETNHKLETIDKKIEGEYVTPQDLYAINFATKVKAEKFVDENGVQITVESFLTGDIYEQAMSSKQAKEQRRNEIGRMKRKILVAVKKHLGMKGNAPNNHIRRVDVDEAVQYIKNLTVANVA